MKNPSLCPSLRSPEKKMAVSVGMYEPFHFIIPFHAYLIEFFKCTLMFNLYFMCNFATGIARGMSYLHSLRTPTIHGDFKPSDVLIPATDLLTPKIANFGLWDFKKYFVENTLPGKKL